MEESVRVDPTLWIHRRLRADSLGNVGTVPQSYLYPTDDNLDSLLELKPNLRTVKGACLKPEHVTSPNKGDVDRKFNLDG